MKTKLVVKVFFMVPLFLFADYVVMVLFGCAASLVGCDNNFFCGTYCTVGKIILGFTVATFLFLIFQEIKTIYKIRENGSSS